MRKLSTVMIISLLVFGFFLGYLRLESNNTVVAPWEPEIELSTDSVTETQVLPRVVVDNGKVHAVWVDDEDGDGDIYYRFSPDNGKTWLPEEDISKDDGTEEEGGVSMAVEGDKVHVVWEETLDPMDPNEAMDVFYTYFDGTSWQPKQLISVDMFLDERQERPEIAVEGDMVHVVWSTSAGTGTPKPFDVDVIYRCFNGTEWQEPREIGRDVEPNVHQAEPDIAVENGRVHVVWIDNRDGEWDIYYRYFNGTSWQPEEEISVEIMGTPHQTFPRIAAENGEVYVVWEQHFNTGPDELDLFYRHFNGTAWEPVKEVSMDFLGTEAQAFGEITVEDGKVHVVYSHLADAINGDIYYRYFNGTSWQNPEEISTDIQIMDQRYPDVAVENGTVHVVWQGGIWGEEDDIYYRRFVPPFPDLQITNDDIVFNPERPVANGTSVNISATVHNIGTMDLNNINVSFYNGDPALGGTLIGLNQTIKILGFGEDGTVNITWLPPSIGTYEIYVAIDYPPPGDIIEDNETNNIAWKILLVTDIPPPTLYIQAVGDDIILNWSQPEVKGLSHYLVYRSTSQTGFDFSKVWINTSQHDDNGIMPLRTTWNDTQAASNIAPQEFYYTLRTVCTSGEISSTSRTVGKWTKTFPQGVSTFSLPLEPLEDMTIDHCLNDMNARYIKWVHPVLHNWMKHGDGAVNDALMKLGEGYEVKFDIETTYAFCGMPGAMISFDDDSGFWGFASNSEAKSLSASIQPNGDVNLTWQEPAGMGMGEWYEIYYSDVRDGFFGTLGIDYSLIDTVDFGTNTATHNGALALDPGTKLYYMVVPFNASGVRGASTYSIGIWTEEYLLGYDTFGIPLKMSSNQTTDWYCDYIPDTVGINFYNITAHRWSWHSKEMPKGAFDPVLEMTEGYQISTSGPTKFTFIGV